MASDKDVAGLYLFGSYGRGSHGPASDIDIAVLLDRDFPSRLLFDKKLGLLSLATRILKTDEVDLVILNQAPPALCFHVLKKGVVLFERTSAKDQIIAFKVRTWNTYFDFQPVGKIIQKGMIDRIRGGRFGV